MRCIRVAVGLPRVAAPTVGSRDTRMATAIMISVATFPRSATQLISHNNASFRMASVYTYSFIKVFHKNGMCVRDKRYPVECLCLYIT